MLDIKGVKYTGPIRDNSGYGRAARGNIMALYKLGIPLTLNPISFEKARPDLGEVGKILDSLVDKKIDYNINFIHTTPEFWEKYREDGVKNCGYCVWETDKLHSSWPGYINNNVDKVIVVCNWNKEVFKKSGVTIPIGVVQHGIDVNEFKDVEPYNIDGITNDTYIFYSIFQFVERKNPLAAIKAYWYAFQNDEKVSLVLKTYRSDYSESEKQAIRTTLKRLKSIMSMDKYPPVYFVSHMLSEKEILGLHMKGDCYVSLDRGEGWGLGGSIAGTCGNSIIVTGIGGVKEYAKEDNSYLVDFQLSPVFGMPWTPWYKGDQLWAEPSVYHGAQIMRHVYKNQDEARDKGLRLKKYISENFTWDHIGKKLVKELEEL